MLTSKLSAVDMSLVNIEASISPFKKAKNSKKKRDKNLFRGISFVTNISHNG